jgi:prophage tail gpP-like protein
MAKVVPIAGKPYTIVKGDTLWDIAAIVYGHGRKYTIIWDANKSALRSGDPNLIYPGEVLWLPPDPAKADLMAESEDGVVAEFDPNAITLQIEGENIPTASISVLLTFDTPSNGWAAEVSHIGKGDIFYESYRPYQYKPCKVWVGNTYIGDTLLYNVDPKWDSSNGTARLEGFCPTVDFVDSVVEPPYQASGVTFEEWISQKAEPFGLPVEMQVAEDKKFKRVKIDRATKAFDHFNGLAKERAYIIGNTPGGGLNVFDAPEDGPSVATFRESTDTPMESGGAGFNGRNRFRKTVGYASGPRKNISETIVDEYISRLRMTSTTVNDTDEVTILEAVRAARNKTLEDALTITIPIRNWYNDNGDVFWPGQFVMAQSDRLYINDPFKFIIKDVELIQNGSKRSGNLTVVPPTVYTGGELEDPWNTEL